MNTQCKGRQLTLQGLDSRQIVVRNDSEVNSSDGGLLLLGKLEQRFGIINKLSNCFTDSRENYRVKHSLKSMLTQRISGIVQGSEDLNDNEEYRKDPPLQYVCGSQQPVTGKSTLNRLDLGMELDEEQELGMQRSAGNLKKLRIFLPRYSWIVSKLLQLKSFWILTSPTFRFTTTSRKNLSTVITTTIAICLSIFFSWKAPAYGVFEAVEHRWVCRN